MFYAPDSDRAHRMREQVAAHLRTPQVVLLAWIRNAPFAGTLTNNQSPRWCPMRIDEHRVSAGTHIDVNYTEALKAHALADNQRRRVVLSGVPSRPSGVGKAGRHKPKPHRGPIRERTLSSHPWSQHLRYSLLRRAVRCGTQSHGSQQHCC